MSWLDVVFFVLIGLWVYDAIQQRRVENEVARMRAKFKEGKP